MTAIRILKARQGQMQPQTDPSRFAKLLREYREEAGLSQAKLAYQSGLDHSHMSRLEHDERTPTRDVVERLANTLELGRVRRVLFFTAAGFMPFSDEIDEQMAARIWSVVLHSRYRKLAQEAWEAAD